MNFGPFWTLVCTSVYSDAHYRCWERLVVHPFFSDKQHRFRQHSSLLITLADSSLPLWHLTAVNSLITPANVITTGFGASCHCAPTIWEADDIFDAAVFSSSSATLPRYFSHYIFLLSLSLLLLTLSLSRPLLLAFLLPLSFYHYFLIPLIFFVFSSPTPVGLPGCLLQHQALSTSYTSTPSRGLSEDSFPMQKRGKEQRVLVIKRRQRNPSCRSFLVWRDTSFIHNIANIASPSSVSENVG